MGILIYITQRRKDAEKEIMKAKLIECNGCFDLGLIPENEQEIVQLVRLAINKTQRIRTYVEAYNDLSLSASVVFGKKRNTTSTINKT